MRYYPLNRVKTDQKTDGTRFTLNGSPYKGPYYETYDGNYFTGPDPIQGPSQALIERENNSLAGAADIGYPNYNNFEAKQKNKLSATLNSPAIALNSSLTTEFKIPQSHYPTPTETDYKRGALVRYFAKKRDRAGFVIEVDKETYDSLQRADSVYDYVNYEAISLFWQISGPFYDDRTNRQYKVAGIIDTNKRIVEAKEQVFTGIKAYIGEDYTRFAKPVGR